MKNASIIFEEKFACGDDFVSEEVFSGNDYDAGVFSASDGSVLDESVASLVDKGANGDNGQPDGSVLELYEELSCLRTNPLGLEVAAGVHHCHDT